MKRKTIIFFFFSTSTFSLSLHPLSLFSTPKGRRKTVPGILPNHAASKKKHMENKKKKKNVSPLHRSYRTSAFGFFASSFTLKASKATAGEDEGENRDLDQIAF